MKTYKSASILITNRPDCWLEMADPQLPAVYWASKMPISIELHTQPAYAALVEATRDGLTPERVRSAIDTAARDTFFRTVIGKKLLVADIEAMEFLAELLTTRAGKVP